MKHKEVAPRLGVALMLAMLASPAMAMPVFPNSPWTFDIEDRSSVYHEPNGSIVTIPIGTLTESVGTPGALGQYMVASGTNVQGPVSQRTIFRAKDVNTGTDTFPSIGKYGMREILTGQFVDSFENNGGEGTGSLTGVNLIHQVGLSLLPPGAGSNEALLGLRQWFGADPRVTFTDQVPSLDENFGKGGLDTDGLATTISGFGGLIKFYTDTTPDAFFGNGLGEGGWSDIGSQFDPNASYPAFDDGTDGSILLGMGVLTPLYHPDLQTPNDPGTLSILLNANFGLGTYANAVTTAALGGAVLLEDFGGPGGGEGVGFINIISGRPEFLSRFDPDAFGPGRDLRLDFQTTAMLGPADNNSNGFLDLQNIVDDSPSGDPGGGPGWNLTSTDPVQGAKVIPEPLTSGLSLLALSSLAMFTSRRRR